MESVTQESRGRRSRGAFGAEFKRTQIGTAGAGPDHGGRVEPRVGNGALAHTALEVVFTYPGWGDRGRVERRRCPGE